MRPLTSVLVVALLLLAGCRSGALRVPAQSLAKPTSPMGKSVFLVVGNGEDANGLVAGNGTAFAAIWRGKTGLFTAWHVVRRKPYIEVNGNGVQQRCGPFVQVDGRDVAWCAMKLPPQWVPLQIAPALESYGSITAWGFPHTEDALVGKVGKDMGRSGFKSDKRGTIRRIEGIAIPGMSGGPLILNAGPHKGKVFAVVSETGLPTRVEHYPAVIPL